MVEKEKEDQDDVKPFASSSKRKLDSAKEKAVVVIDDEEDVKPFKKRPRSSAGSSKDTAIDLTKL